MKGRWNAWPRVPIREHLPHQNMGEHQSYGGQDKPNFPALVAIGDPRQLSEPADAVFEENRQ